jgi:predicted nucleotidyltransferase
LLDLNSIAEGFFDPIERVVDQMLNQAPALDPDQVMLVGAWCRDTLHAALGHDFETRATRDVDIALALSGWDLYEQLAEVFPAASDTGVAFRIAGMMVDLLPFGELEDPEGEVRPPRRDDTISVWAFTEIFNAALPLSLNPSLTIRCPTVPGYTAAKLAAWLDRSAWGEPKDANDLALSVHWYEESVAVQDRLYESAQGQEILIAEEADVPLAAARVLGVDVAALIGPERLAELLGRWPGNIEMLVRNFVIPAAAHVAQESRRLEIIQALTRGLAEPI